MMITNEDRSYKTQVLTSMIKGMIQEKMRQGWIIRPNCLMEDAAGNVFTFNVDQTETEVKLNLKRVDLI